MLKTQPDIEQAPAPITSLETTWWLWPEARLAYAGLRLLFGLNLLMHGLVRLVSGLSQFVATTTQSFQGTLLPATMVRGFAYCIPPVETALGVLILLGVAPRVVYLLCMAWMAVLTMGSSVQQNWNAVGIQLWYGLVLFVLLLSSICDRRPRSSISELSRTHPADAGAASDA